MERSVEMTKGTKLDCLPDELPLNRKDYKFEDNKMYVRASLNEPVFIPFDEILTKKDLVKLIEIFGAYTTLMCQHKGDIGYDNLTHFTEDLLHTVL